MKKAPALLAREAPIAIAVSANPITSEFFKISLDKFARVSYSFFTSPINAILCFP